MSRLSLYLFGAPRIERDDVPIEVETRKAIALVAYLAITGERHRRETLVNLLWPELDQSHGRAALRRTLYALRKPLGGEWLDADRESIELRPDADLWLDVDQFHSTLAQCLVHDHPVTKVCLACLPLLNAAVELYRGDFMQGFSLRDSLNFDDWQFYQADRLRREFIDALARLARGHSAQGTFEPALRYAWRWLAVDSLDEQAHAQLMRLYAWTGQRSAALRQYEECARILENQLGVSPQASTTTLHKAIRDGRPPPLSAGLPRPPASAPEPHRLSFPPPRSPTAEEGEKRLVTALVADAGISVHKVGSLSADEGAFLKRRFRQTIEGVLTHYGGRVERAQGWSVLVVLGTRESDPEVAVRAALEMRRAIRTLELNVAVGIDTGEGTLDPSDTKDGRGVTSLGPAVDMATLLAGQARDGQILIGEATYRLTRRAFTATPLAVQIVGVNEPVPAYQVNRLLAQPQKARGIEGLRARLVGRDEELTKLRVTLDRVLAGEGQMVSLIGEAGVGKSRLVAELREGALTTRNTRPLPLWLEGRCLDLGTTVGYAPFLDILSQQFAWTAQDHENARCARIVSALEEMVDRGALSKDRSQEMGRRLCRLLVTQPEGRSGSKQDGESPARIQHRTFLAIRDLVLALCERQPVILVFEDLHWADDLSLDLIALLMESLPRAPLYLLCVYRPERGHRCMHLGTVAARKCGDRYTEMVLRELVQGQSRRLVALLLAGGSLSPVVSDLILERSQGNPFYIEEVVRSLIDAGIVYREGDAWLARTEIQGPAVPESVQSVVLSRLERLPADLKRVLQVAAVIGRVFSRRRLERAVGEQTRLQGLLWELEDRALIYQDRAVPEVEYSFKHVLAQEAIYDRLLPSRREALHRQVADAIEALHGENLDEVCEQLAYHYDRGGGVDKAVAYLQRAGRKAQRSYANQAAIAHLTRGLELLKSLPEAPERDQRELDTLVPLGVSLVLIKGHSAPEVEATYARARALCARVGGPLDRFQILVGLRRYYVSRGELGTGYEVGAELLTLAEQIQDAGTLARAHAIHGETNYWLGAFSQARAHYERGLALYDPLQHRSHMSLYGNDTKVSCLIFYALTLWQLGYPDQSLSRAKEAIALAQELPHPFNMTFAPFFAAMLYQLRREERNALEWAEVVIRQASEHGFSLFATMGSMIHSWALQSRTESERMQQGITTFREIGIGTIQPFFLASLAEVCLQVGQIDEGRRFVDEALALIEKSQERCWEAELFRLKGELLLALGQEVKGQEIKGEACFQRAIDVARSQAARSWEVRAATSLGRLWQRQGKTREARALLQGIYGWFSEGLDTADLAKARELLDELA